MFRIVVEFEAPRAGQPLAEVFAVRAAPLAMADVLALMVAKQQMNPPVMVMADASKPAPVWAFDDYAGMGRVLPAGRALAEWLAIVFGETPVNVVPDAVPSSLANRMPAPTTILLPRTQRSMKRIGMTADDVVAWLAMKLDGPEIFAHRQADIVRQSADAAWVGFDNRVADAVEIWHRQLEAHGLADHRGIVRHWHNGEKTVAAVGAAVDRAAEREAKTLANHAAKIRAQLQPNGTEQVLGLSADFLADLVGGPAALIRELWPFIEPANKHGRVLALD